MSSDRETRTDRGFFTLFIATMALMVALIALIAVAFKVNPGGDGAAAANVVARPARPALPRRRRRLPPNRARWSSRATKSTPRRALKANGTTPICRRTSRSRPGRPSR